MSTVLLTGASGFTGQYMEQALKSQGNVVHALQGSLLDVEPVQEQVLRTQPDWVIHLAAISSVAHHDQEAFYKVNVFGTLNLLEALTKLKKLPQKVLIASSANVYGMPNVDIIDESICPKPVNHYACSKLAMEHLIHNYFDQIPIIITRPFNYTGIGQKTNFLIPKLVEHFALRRPTLQLGALNISRDFSDVSDVVRSYQALLESDHHSEIVNICSGKSVTLTYIIQILEQLTGYSPKIEIQPSLVRKNDITKLCGSNLKLKSMINASTFKSIAETLQNMLKKYF